ncbi:sugar porter family MFS transporter [Winogradskyella alexanderae]|uniref:Sugar porter family MFS transporter n=1 Tax=Winogradskyella alexanderae TaxID=2877123 RepID=A0ABS7XTZ0_9FLAO|nr:sugar porter family MFS transporter [Winogradskyella alexanderae]MCA0133497.1 sugar porter family MFS transporter [Winogradskyella alexanderae]
MSKKSLFTIRIALIVALGGFLMGFDASVISGVNKFIQIDFNLTDLELGFSVSSLTIIAALSMMVSGPLSDKFGRRIMLKICAIVFTISAVGSALAPNFLLFLIFRMLGGFGVGASLILAPMYIAEISPPGQRGKLVSFNQLNIVLGITVAFFSNYYILSLGNSNAEWVQSLGIGENNWRWMLGVEAIPAVFYFFGLLSVPRSPRWLVMKNHLDEAKTVLQRFYDADRAEKDMIAIRTSLESDKNKEKVSIMEIFKPAMRLVITIGLVVGVLQQITGINSVFFYAPMIFEQSGIGTDASFIQAILVGVTNLVFTVLAMLLIDKLGRKPLLIFGVTGIGVFMCLLAYGFNTATYSLSPEKVNQISNTEIREKVAVLEGQSFKNDVVYKNEIKTLLGNEKAKQYESELITAAISMNPNLILIGILGFVACFAISLGPVMWVLFSELFPLRIRGVAISFVGFVNSAVSAGVQFLFPWELSTIGSAMTFLIYGLFAFASLIFIIKVIPETKGKSLEELEAQLVK